MTIDLHIKNAYVWDGNQTTRRDLYTKNGRIVDQPANGAHIVDLDGYTIFPGLVNAHDHLELNHYPRSKFRDVYDNAHQWGEDMNARLDTEPYKSLRAYPLRDRLFIGGLKNLLCGATTVAHHGPPHKPMYAKDFPVRVLKNYGWAHSLHFNTEQEIIDSYRKTPKDWPWFIHLAEGTDEVAASEYEQLLTLECFRQNTVIVHGVGLRNIKIGDFEFPNICGWVICPSSNKFLLGEIPTQDNNNIFYDYLWLNDLALGSDSRLTAEGDLLDEMRMAHNRIIDDDIAFVIGNTFLQSSASHIFHMVTTWGADILKCRNIAELSKGHVSDYIVIQTVNDESRGYYEVEKLCNSHRADLALIVKDGIPQIGDPDMMAKFLQVQTVAATLDGVPKAIHIELARHIHQCTLKEPGLEVDGLPTKRFWLI